MVIFDERPKHVLTCRPWNSNQETGSPAVDGAIRDAMDELLGTASGGRWSDTVRQDVYLLAMRQRARSPERWLPEVRAAIDHAARQRGAASSGAIGAEAWQQIFVQG